MAVYIARKCGSTGTGGVSGSFVTTTGEAQTIFGEKTFSNDSFFSNVNISGDLTVDGFVTASLEVSDDIILLNAGEGAAGVSSGTAGLEIDRGSETNALLVFVENSLGVTSDNRWMIDIGDGVLEQIVYDNIPDDITLSGAVTVNNDLIVNFDLSIASLAGNPGEVITVNATGGLEASGFTIADLQGGGTSNISAGEGITLTPSGGATYISVTDYISKTEVANISGNLQTQITSVSTGTSGITGGLTQLDGRYAPYTDVDKNLTYNAKDELISITSSVGTQTFSYYTSGPLKGLVQSITGTGVYNSKTFTYDAKGNLINIDVL